MKRLITNKKIALAGLFLAIVIILQLLAMIIPGTVDINLSLIPIILGSIFIGPITGAFLGFMSGVIILCSPSTITVFMLLDPPVTVITTVITCLLKTTIAGAIAGLVFKLLQKKYDLVGAILASILVPLINTMTFAVFCYFFFKDGLGLPSFGAILTAFIGMNFLLEVIICVLLGPTIYKLLKNRVNNF